MSGDRILLVEDDDRIGSNLTRALRGNGFDAEWVTTGRAAIDAARRARADLVLLDLALADLDGLEVCRAIHALDATVPIVMVTARDTELDIVVGLDAGAIDYVTKPFKLAELLARIRAQLRRPLPSSDETNRVGDVTIDRSARRVWVSGAEVEFRPKEFDLLARLAADAGHAVSRDTLMADVWDEHWHGSTKTLDFHVAALRRKIDRPTGPSRITTLRGVGFRLEST
jgi:DNA-binding response OmpR family regulator